LSDWILGLKKAASGWMPGVGIEQLHRAEVRVGAELPEELRTLYRQLDGAQFENGVVLLPLQDRGRGQLGPGEPSSGLPGQGVWIFGTRGEGEPLFAAQKGTLARVSEGKDVPDWFSALPDDAWVFGAQSVRGELSLHRGLEQLLSASVPPAETEEFGESTFMRALSAVGFVLEEAAGDKAEAPALPGMVPSTLKESDTGVPQAVQTSASESVRTSAADEATAEPVPVPGASGASRSKGARAKRPEKTGSPASSAKARVSSPRALAKTPAQRTRKKASAKAKPKALASRSKPEATSRKKKPAKAKTTAGSTKASGSSQAKRPKKAGARVVKQAASSSRSPARKATASGRGTVRKAKPRTRPGKLPPRRR